MDFSDDDWENVINDKHINAKGPSYAAALKTGLKSA